MLVGMIKENSDVAPMKLNTVKNITNELIGVRNF